MKKRVFLGLAAVAIMVSGITAGVAWTRVAHAEEGTTAKSFASRLATILELEEDVVQDAFKEARRDIQDERFQTRMDRLVESERITQDEADAAIEWYEERPEGINTSRRGSKSGFHGQRGPGSKSGFYGQRGSGSKSGFYGRRGPGPDSGFRGQGRHGASRGNQSRWGPPSNIGEPRWVRAATAAGAAQWALASAGTQGATPGFRPSYSCLTAPDSLQ